METQMNNHKFITLVPIDQQFASYHFIFKDKNSSFIEAPIFLTSNCSISASTEEIHKNMIMFAFTHDKKAFSLVKYLLEAIALEEQITFNSKYFWKINQV